MWKNMGSKTLSQPSDLQQSESEFEKKKIRYTVNNLFCLYFQLSKSDA